MDEMEQFSNIEEFESLVKSDILKGGYQIEDVPFPHEQFILYFKVPIESQNMNVIVGMVKETAYKLEIVSSLSFSQNHIETLKDNPDDIKQKMVESLSMWLLPRTGNFAIELNEENDFEMSFMINIVPIYEGDYSFAKLMESIDRIISYTILSRKIIQSNLNKYDNQKKEDLE